jgi:putative ABC transport system ATP-binding protein
MIELEKIERTFQVGGEQVHALRGVDLRIERGEYVSIMGPSGSGKSTLLNILGCLDRPTAGVYRLDGREVENLGEDELARLRRDTIGFVFQFFHLVPRLSAAENVGLPLLFAGIEPAERRRRVDAALSSVGLAERARHRPDQLSGGERQRVAIARALITEPAVLLADEPTGNLDTRSGSGIVHLLEELNARQITLLVVTHDPGIAERAKRRIRIVDGAIQSDEPGARALHSEKVRP